MTSSLYERIGGAKAVEAAVEAAVDLFYNKIQNDPDLISFFDGIDLKRQRKMQEKFLTAAFGGTDQYSGRALRAAHERPVKIGLNERHFDKVARHLQRTLLEMNVPYELIQEVMVITGSTKNDVLNN